MFTLYFVESYYRMGMARVEHYDDEKQAREAMTQSNAKRVLLTGPYGERLAEIKER